MDTAHVLAAWTETLDRLERDVRAAEALAADPGTATSSRRAQDSWEPPALPGVLPADLVGRAQELLRRQTEASRALAARAAAVRDEQSRLRGRARDSVGSGSAYLDVRA